MKYSKLYRYGMVGLNLLCVVLTFFFLILTESLENNTLFAILTGLSLIVLLITYYLMYHKTGVWNFVHRKSEELDERELALSRRSTEWAYQWFTVISLSLFFLIGYSIAVPWLHLDRDVYAAILRSAVASLIYLAHILPGIAVIIREEYLDFAASGDTE